MWIYICVPCTSMILWPVCAFVNGAFVFVGREISFLVLYIPTCRHRLSTPYPTLPPFSRCWHTCTHHSLSLLPLLLPSLSSPSSSPPSPPPSLSLIRCCTYQTPSAGKGRMTLPVSSRTMSPPNQPPQS